MLKLNLFSDFRRNRRGFVGDILMLAIFMFVLGLTIMVGYLTLSSVNTQFQSQASIGTVGQGIVNDATNKYTGLWDGIFGFLLVGLSLAAIISAYFVDTHPILFPMMLIVLAAYIVVSGALANAYFAVESASAFSSFAENFRLMHYIMTHLAYYVAIQGFLIFVALFAKTGA